MISKVLNCIIIILFLLFVTKVLGECEIRYPENPLVKPRFKKIFGSREIQIPSNNDFTTIQSDEEIIAYCDIKFEEPDRYNEFNELNIKCNGYNIYLNENYYADRNVLLKCSPLKWNLYELSKPIIQCPWDMASYLLARQNDAADSKIYTILAGICYDIDNISLRALFHKMSPKHLPSWLLEPGTDLENYPSITQIKNLKQIFGIRSITPDKYDNQQFQDWIKFANYQFNSTIQNPVLYNEIYSQFGSLLDFAWWPNLRLGNWKRYEESLAKQIENKNISYNIFSGISGTVKAPVKENCQNNFTMKELADKANQKLPLYIWSYILPALPHNSSDEVVVIGFNSPFYEFYSEEEVVFCQDICSEIEWLKNIQTTFRYSTMGIMFCCSAEEVGASKLLSGFPNSLNEPIFETTTKVTPEYIPRKGADYLSRINILHSLPKH